MTKQARHTAGPWEFDEDFDVMAPGGMVICNVSSACDFPCVSEEGDRDEDEVRAELDAECAANGRLIAAGPDILAALREAVEVLDIAEMYGLYAKGSLGEIDIKDSRDAARAAIAKATQPAA